MPFALVADSPPEDIPAEQSVLGSMMIEAEAVDAASALLSCADFSRPAHQQVFAAMLALRDAGRPVDMVTLPAEMARAGVLDGIGGVGYLLSLFDAVPTAANVRFYAEGVAEKARQRRLWETMQRALAALGTGVKDSGAFLALFQADLTRAQGPARSAPARKPFADTVLSFRRIPPPPAELPYLFGPYLNLGAAHWLTGQHGIGKSTWLYNVLPALAEGRTLWGIPTKPTRVLYLDMESGSLGRSMKAQRLFPDRADAPGLDNLLVQPEAPRFPGDLPALLSFTADKGIDLVVFDTARRCFSVEEENSNSEFYLKIVPILDALKAAGVATLTMGHPPKNGGLGARGAGAQEDAGDVNLTLTMHSGEKSDPGGILALRVTKNRLLGLDIPALFLRRAGDDRFEAVGPGSVTEEKQETPCAAEVRRFLFRREGTPAKHTEIVTALTEAGFPAGTAKRTISEMQGAGVISNHLDLGGYILEDPPPA